MRLCAVCVCVLFSFLSIPFAAGISGDCLFSLSLCSELLLAQQRKKKKKNKTMMMKKERAKENFKWWFKSLESKRITSKRFILYSFLVNKLSCLYFMRCIRNEFASSLSVSFSLSCSSRLRQLNAFELLFSSTTFFFDYTTTDNIERWNEFQSKWKKQKKKSWTITWWTEKRTDWSIKSSINEFGRPYNLI